jgi:hypothetical protein
MPRDTAMRAPVHLRWSREVTVRDWWRWTLRGVAVLALVAGGVLLGLHPTASYRLHGNRLALSAQCVSPFDRLRGEPVSPILVDSIPPASAIPNMRAVSAACSSAIAGREHIVEALGGSAALLVALSFLPRRRALATKRSLEPSRV